MHKKITRRIIIYLRTITIVKCDNAHKLDCKLCPLQEFILKVSSKVSAKLGISFLPLLKNDQNARNLFMLDTPEGQAGPSSL